MSEEFDAALSAAQQPQFVMPPSPGIPFYVAEETEPMPAFFSEDLEPHDPLEGVALAGQDGLRVAHLLEAVQAAGREKLHTLTSTAVRRLLADSDMLGETTLFNAEELAELQDSLAKALAAGDLLGRVRVRRLAEHFGKTPAPQLAEGFRAFSCPKCGGVAYDGVPETGVKYLGTTLCTGCRSFEPRRNMQPLDVERYAEIVRGDPNPFEIFEDAVPVGLKPPAAVDYFRKLVPTVGVKSPERYGKYLERRAFTLAVDTDETLLARVKDVIQSRLEDGVPVDPARDIDAILEESGVAPQNPYYADMVFRTNAMDAYTQGQQQEYADPEVEDEFPAWEYHAIVDSRSRPHHAERDSGLYPASVSFNEVRGTEPAELINCRCAWSPVHRVVLQRRLAAGEQFREPPW
jgi:SPP1 gp7 family putative phage head morphogenesis protein